MQTYGQTHVLDPMHVQSQRVDEILRLINLELVASERKVTAVGLACCCKSFEDPALDALWATRCQLFPLLESFAGDIFKEGGHCEYAKNIHFFPFP